MRLRYGLPTNRVPTGSDARLWADLRSGPVDAPIALQGAGFPSNTLLKLTLDTVRGTRISGGGWEVVERDLVEVQTDMNGAPLSGRPRLTPPSSPRAPAGRSLR